MMFPIGLFLGVGFGYGTRARLQWNLTYAPARIALKAPVPGFVRPQAVALWEGWLRRLAFADRQEFFSGVEQRSGFATGRLSLETELDLSRVERVEDFYQPGAVRPSSADFTGAATTRRRSLTADAKEAGRLNAVKHQERIRGARNAWQWAAEYKGVTAGIAMTVIGVIILYSGVEIDPSRLGELFGG